MPCHTFLFNINLTINFISFIDNLTIVGVGNRLLNGITYVPIVLNLGTYDTEWYCNGRFFGWTIDQQRTIVLDLLAFYIWVLECVGAKAYCCGCYRHLVNVVVSLIGMPLFLLSCYNCHILYFCWYLPTIILPFILLLYSGTIIMLMPPFPHYTTTGYTIPIHH